MFVKEDVAATVVVLVTGHPGAGKTTLARFLAPELGLPLILKDQIKELLLDTLGTSTAEWSRRLSTATWALLYKQVENLLSAGVSHVVESNFDPVYANGHWQELRQKYDFCLIQVRCEIDPEVLLRRYRLRIAKGERHIGHVDESHDRKFLASIRQHMDWVATEGVRFSFDTTDASREDYLAIGKAIGDLLPDSPLSR